MKNDLLDAYINIYQNSIDIEYFFGHLFNQAYDNWVNKVAYRNYVE